ncbi:histidine kinase [Mucilaginibacter frigoritolerans]|jgi:two-component system, LytTR family, sensor kinase|uniref:Histidine kinase n=1 Tax=Mucilaginibacter frigoritolerans TaxID=652788 RepID=A0A562U9B1_9SPHI|nr:histidine kinase [Mucilaginibacter frigoritolerans]TWJ02423.1 histidine kinase [Mucilaginibacter frigoritolerans]
MISIKKKDWIEVVLHIAFWIGVFYALLSLTESHVMIRIDHDVATMKKDFVIRRDVKHTLSPHLFLTFGFLVLLFYGNIFLLFKKALRYKNILIRVAIPVLYFVAIIMASYYTDKLLPTQNNGQPAIHTFKFDRGKDLSGPPPNIKKDNFIAQTNAVVFAPDGLSNSVWFVFIIVFGLSIAYFFLKEWARAEKFRVQLEAVQLDTEIKFLKSQVNPHFLFNTLNNLFSMAQEKGNDNLADGISKLSGMMRYMIYESNEENVPLKKEIEYLDNCILLNKLRYADDEVNVIFDYPEQTEGIFVAPMLFIPFVENAFKHGVAIGQSSEIDISIAVVNKQLIFTCENTIYGVKKMEDEKSGIGLENVKRRLELVYPNKHELAIKDSGGKFAVELKINLHS